MTDYQKYINALRKCAKEHENDRTFTGHIIVSDLCRDTVNLLEALEQEPKTEWIPVSERLPESNGVYIVSRWFSDGEESAILTDANYYDGNGYWYDDNRINWGRDLVTDKIVAWMPLPEPYKAESEVEECR